MNILKLSIISLGLQLLPLGCATAPKDPIEKPYDFCVCGPTFSSIGNAQCAIWGETANSNQAQKVWQSVPRASCEPNDCSQLFSKFCKKIQMAPLAKIEPLAAKAFCYCDSVLIENSKGQVQLNCAAWSGDSKNLIEYYPLDDCKPQRCAQAPFVRAASQCNNSFKAFYPPLSNRR